MTIETEIRDLTDTLKSMIGSGSLGAGQTASATEKIIDSRKEARSKAQQMKMDAAMHAIQKESVTVLGSFNKALGKYTKDMKMRSEILQQSFEEAAKSLSPQNLELVPKALENELKKSPMFSKANITNLEQAFEFFDNMADKRAMFESGAIQQYLSDQTKVTAEQMEILEKVAKAEGKTVKEVALQKRHYIKEVKEASIAQQNLTQAMRETKTETLAEKFKSLNEPFTKLKTVVEAAGRAVLQVATPAMKFGTEIDDSLTSFMAGMSPTEMAQNVATFRQSIQAAGMSTQEFRDITEQGSLALTGYTGDIKDAVKVQASTFEAAKRMGLSERGEMRAFMDEQVSTFQKFNRVFSMTSEQFIEMNKSIKNSTAINEHMYRLNQKQRAQAFQDIQQTMLRLRTMGLMQEQAMKVVEAMSAIAGKSPKERLKEAAKLQAVGGALGFGAEAGQAAEIMRRGFRQEGDRERFAELQQTMQKGMGEFMGQGLPQEMMAMQMLQTTGMEDLLGPKSAFNALNTEQNMATQGVEKLMDKRVEQGAQVIGWLQRIQSALGGPIMKALGAIGPILGGLVASLAGGGMLKKLAGSLLGGGGSAAASKVGKGLLVNTLKLGARMIPGLGLVTLLGGFAWDYFKKKEKEKEKELGKTGMSKELDAARESYIKEAAETASVELGKSKGLLEGYVKGLNLDPKSFTMGGSDAGPLGDKNAIKKLAIAGETMTEKEFMAKPFEKRMELKLQHAIQEIEKAQEVAALKAHTLKGDEKKLAEENKKFMEQQLEALQTLLTKIDPETPIETLNQLKKNNADQAAQHKEKMDQDDKNAKNVKIQWARAPAAS